MLEKGTRARTVSVELFQPAFHSPQRQASLSSAVFSLVSTILGGGVLSLPYAFKSAGLLAGGIMLLLVAMASDFSIYILVSCSRRSGGNTYEGVAYRAFGRPAQIFTVVLVFVLVFLSCVAYAILCRDLVSPLFELAFSTSLSQHGRTVIMVLCMVAVFPVCLLKSLNALRFSSVVAVISIVCMGLAVCYRSVQAVYGIPYEQTVAEIQHQHYGPGSSPLVFVSPDMSELIYSFPLICVAYLCHFNVLPLHTELERPTRARIKKMIHSVMGVCSIMYFWIGFFGYLFGRELTDADILNNFAPNDMVILIGRLGLSLTILCSFPLLVHPARNALQEILSIIGGEQRIVEPSLESSFSPALGPSVSPASSTATLPKSSSTKSLPDVSDPVPIGTPIPSKNDEEVQGPVTLVATGSIDTGLAIQQRMKENRRILRQRQLVASQYQQQSVNARSRLRTHSTTTNNQSHNNSNYGSLSSSTSSTLSPVRGSLSPHNKPAHNIDSNEALNVTIVGDSKGHTNLGDCHSHSHSNLDQVDPDDIAEDTLEAEWEEEDLIERALSSGDTESVNTVMRRRASLSKSRSFTDLLSGRKMTIIPAEESKLAERPFNVMVLETFCIVFNAVLLAIFVPSIATIWSIMGSTVSIIIAYILPSACYLKIRSKKAFTVRHLAAWILLVLGIVACVVCSYQAVSQLYAPNQNHADASGKS